jgi:multidrug efflux pump subunit AcrB
MKRQRSTGRHQCCNVTIPSGMPSPPEYFKVNPSQSPIFYLALSSAHLSAGKLYEIASNQLTAQSCAD